MGSVVSRVKDGERRLVPPGHQPISPQMQYVPNPEREPTAAVGRQRPMRSKSLVTAVKAGTKHAARGLARSTTFNSHFRQNGAAVGAGRRSNDRPPNTSTLPTAEAYPQTSPTSQLTDSIGGHRRYGSAPPLPSFQAFDDEAGNSEVPRAVPFYENLPRPHREHDPRAVPFSENLPRPHREHDPRAVPFSENLPRPHREHGPRAVPFNGNLYRPRCHRVAGVVPFSERPPPPHREHAPRAVPFSERPPRPRLEHAKLHTSVSTDHYSWEDRFADPPEPAETNCEIPHGHANDLSGGPVRNCRDLSGPPKTESVEQFLGRRGRRPPIPFDFTTESGLSFAQGRHGHLPGLPGPEHGAAGGFHGDRRLEASAYASANERGQFHFNARRSFYDCNGIYQSGTDYEDSFSPGRKRCTGDNPCPAAPDNQWKEAEQNWAEGERESAEARREVSDLRLPLIIKYICDEEKRQKREYASGEMK